MELNNNTLRTEDTVSFYVIEAMKDGCRKYIGRHYFRKNAFKYTVLLTKAMRFNTRVDAVNFIDDTELCFPEIKKVERVLSVIG